MSNNQKEKSDAKDLCQHFIDNGNYNEEEATIIAKQCSRVKTIKVTATASNYLYGTDNVYYDSVEQQIIIHTDKYGTAYLKAPFYFMDNLKESVKPMYGFAMKVYDIYSNLDDLLEQPFSKGKNWGRVYNNTNEIDYISISVDDYKLLSAYIDKKFGVIKYRYEPRGCTLANTKDMIIKALFKFFYIKPSDKLETFLYDENRDVKNI